MADLAAVWHAAQELLPLLGRRQSPAALAAIEQSGVTGRPLGMLLHASDVAPRPLTVAVLHACTPYYAAAVFEERMIDLAEHGFLQRESDGYVLTSTGRAAADEIERAAFDALAAFHPLPAHDLDRLVGYFERVVAAADVNPATPDCPCLRDQAKPDRPHAESYLGWLAQYIGDLYRYKCDCHTTAWRPTGVSGFAMEPFTLIWRDGISTMAGLIARVGQERMGRGHTDGDYARFVDELAGHGWLAWDDDTFALTERGRAVRDDIEAQTDAAFYSVWRTLTDDEQDDMATMIASLSKGIA
jgi:hypothetical protein